MDGEVAVLDDDFRPELRIERLAVDQPAVRFGEQAQDVQRLARDGNTLALPGQAALERIEDERADPSRVVGNELLQLWCEYYARELIFY